MENYYFDSDGVYVFSAPANPGTLAPANALRARPPERVGYWAVLNSERNGWDMAEDHRGRRGRIGGRAVEIRELGPLPEGWSDEPLFCDAPEIGDYHEARAAAFAIEADPLRDLALGYQAEAEGWSLVEDGDHEEEARAKAQEHLRLYTAKKAEIRLRFPGPSGEETVVSAQETGAAESADSFYLTGTGTYHAKGCSSTRAAGEWLPLAEIQDRNPDARPCGRCKPTVAEG